MLVNCLNCNKEFNKEKKDINRSKNHFCSRSCSCAYNNKKSPRRKPEGKCSVCNTPIRSVLKYCKNCRETVNDNDQLSEVIYKKHHPSSAFALVRSRARSIAKKLGWKSCKHCGYDKHIEIAHIKPVSSFPGTALVKEINDPSNLIPLCPNCHWEHDHPASL